MEDVLIKTGFVMQKIVVAMFFILTLVVAPKPVLADSAARGGTLFRNRAMYSRSLFRGPGLPCIWTIGNISANWLKME